MGQTKELSCECGYRKELHIGTGLMGINETVVRKTFDPGELTDFDDAKNKGILKRFIMENVKAYCSVCNDIFSIPTLKYIIDDADKIIRKNCPGCGGKTTETKTADCPKCGRGLEEKTTGHWD